MLVAITGATGFVGSHIADELSKRGYQVRCLLRQSSNTRWIDGKPYEKTICTFNDSSSIKRALTDCDAVIHVAGLIAARSLEEFMEGNRNLTQRLLEATYSGVQSSFHRFIHISSLAACGPATSLHHPCAETTTPHPITPYGISKKAAEDVVMNWSSLLPITLIRPPAVYGERDEATLPFFRAVSRGIIPLIGFSPKWVSLIHVYDLAMGVVDALESSVTNGKLYFVSSEEFYTWKQIGITTAAIMGKRAVPIVVPHIIVLALAGLSGFIGHLQGKAPVLDYYKGRDIIQQYWICSPEHARTDFGYKQMVSLEEGIARTVDWYKFHRWL